ncbi:hypothetical protein BZA70DRAFT_271383 [Myxozyma melibiosi]|uniref:Mtf2-like C-terminal domain-containing protein n=1 Tax=Myxozyma melibiosi TaxID=54550 RepID=A0ABR1FEK8_9ASCO
MISTGRTSGLVRQLQSTATRHLPSSHSRQYAGGFLADELRRLTDPTEDNTPKAEKKDAGDKAGEPAKDDSEWSFLTSEVPLMTMLQQYKQSNVRKDGSEDWTYASKGAPARQFEHDQESVRKNTGRSTLKEREVFERVFRDIARGATSSKEKTPAKGGKKKAASSFWDEQPLSFAKPESPLSFGRFDNQTSGDYVSYMRKRRFTPGARKDPLKWLNIASPVMDANMYPQSLREIAKSLQDIRVNSTVMMDQPDRADEVEWERQRMLREMKDRMRACESDLELDGMLEREVYKPFREAAKHFQGQEAQIAHATATNYPALLLEAMKIMNTKFREAYGALSVFYRARDYGVYSYMLGCTIDVYNQALRIQWTNFQDMFECKNLLEEIVANGVEANTETIGIVQMMRRETMKRTSGTDSEGALDILTQESDEYGASYRNVRFA